MNKQDNWRVSAVMPPEIEKAVLCLAEGVELLIGYDPSAYQFLEDAKLMRNVAQHRIGSMSDKQYSHYRLLRSQGRQYNRTVDQLAKVDEEVE